ncbi:hypothetical protein [Huintestinicola sp.]|uniref:hypothetical protein n=1 Tax=Huintestinicola sp. TaxID=2981661 RepID=UPI003D7C37A5
MKNKIPVFLAAFILFSEMLTIRAYAYIDVTATTYIIQIAAGAVVALGAVIGVVVSKIKKKAKEKFNIDLDKKEKEEDVVVYSEDKDK